FGPFIVTGLDPTQLRIVVRHNGTVWEDFSSGDQIWDTATWLAEMSKTATLHPGDVLWMGTQGADGDMVPGDVIEVEIGGIGVLRNYVVAGKWRDGDAEDRHARPGDELLLSGARGGRARPVSRGGSGCPRRAPAVARRGERPARWFRRFRGRRRAHHLARVSGLEGRQARCHALAGHA